MKNASQNGSAIFIVILAVAMFAALSYAVFMGRGESMSAMTDQQAKLAAEEIIAYGDALAKAVQTLKLRGCSDTQFDFANTSWKNQAGVIIHNTGHNPSAPSTGCSVFSPSDGKITPILFPLNYFISVTGTDTAPGASKIRVGSMPGVGDAAQPDMIWLLPHIKDEICIKINKLLGVASTSSTVPEHTLSGGLADYTGTYTSGSLVDSSGELTGHSAYCTIRSAGGSTNRYMKTLIVR